MQTEMGVIIPLPGLTERTLEDLVLGVTEQAVIDQCIGTGVSLLVIGAGLPCTGIQVLDAGTKEVVCEIRG